jgi:hypothetical protein
VGCPRACQVSFSIDFSGGKIAFRVFVSMNRPLSRLEFLLSLEKNKTAREREREREREGPVSRVVAVAEVNIEFKFPVINSVFCEEDQSEVRMNSRDALKILVVTDKF